MVQGQHACQYEQSHKVQEKKEVLFFKKPILHLKLIGIYFFLSISVKLNAFEAFSLNCVYNFNLNVNEKKIIF